MSEAFFEPGDGRWHATEQTRGPWDADSQHAGPPAALLARALERTGADDGSRIARVAVEILRPIPITELRIETELVRPGRRIQLLAGTLADRDGALLRLSAWRIALPAPGDPDPRSTSPRGADPPGGERGEAGMLEGGPDAAEPKPFFEVPWDTGYHTAMEFRFSHGGFREAGPALAWSRMRVPLVPGERPTPLQRVLCAADSGNGISSRLDLRRWLFVNTDLVVSLFRHPDGEWVGLDATTQLGGEGVGLADTRLLDEQGPIGRGTQTLVVAPAPSA